MSAPDKICCGSYAAGGWHSEDCLGNRPLEKQGFPRPTQTCTTCGTACGACYASQHEEANRTNMATGLKLSEVYEEFEDPYSGETLYRKRETLPNNASTHDPDCDSLSLSPSLGSSMKPCNCVKRTQEAPTPDVCTSCGVPDEGDEHGTYCPEPRHLFREVMAELIKAGFPSPQNNADFAIPKAMAALVRKHVNRSDNVTPPTSAEVQILRRIADYASSLADCPPGLSVLVSKWQRMPKTSRDPDYPRISGTLGDVLKMIDARIDVLAEHKRNPDYDPEMVVCASNELVALAEEIEERWPDVRRTDSASPTKGK